jgi:hypothetical protein
MRVAYARDLQGLRDERAELLAALDAANADAADQHNGRKWAQRLVGSLPDEMRITFDSRMDELDAAHRARIEAQP